MFSKFNALNSDLADSLLCLESEDAPISVYGPSLYGTFPQVSYMTLIRAEKPSSALDLTSATSEVDDTPYLTPREREVLLWAARGKSAWETAQLLGLSEKTIKFYLRNASSRLNTKNKTHAVATSLILGLIAL